METMEGIRAVDPEGKYIPGDDTTRYPLTRQLRVNSTLYLFTFLTTLLLLLAVSCGIVIRSFILRR